MSMLVIEHAVVQITSHMYAREHMNDIELNMFDVMTSNLVVACRVVHIWNGGFRNV